MIIGIDGGGTKTTGIVVDNEGHILAMATVGPSNPNSAEPDKVKQELATLFEQLTKSITLDGNMVIFAGVSGVESGGKKEWLATIIKEITASKAEVMVDNDAITALYSVTKGKPGIVSICGTGSITFGVNAQGERDRVGGWGYLINDNASGFALGKRLLDYIFAQHDKGEEQCPLTKAALEHVQLQKVDEFVPFIYELGKTRDRMASLAKVIIDFSKKGDAFASRTLEDAAESILKDINILYIKLHKENSSTLPVVLTGGIIQHADVMRDCLVRKAAERKLPFSFVCSGLPPITGAVYAAMKGRGVNPTAEFSARLEESLKEFTRKARHLS